MSHETFNEEWKSAQNYLSKTISIDPSQPDRRENRKLLATLYIRYILIANKLSSCVNQMVQPQKLRLLRKLLEGVLGRILELKTDLIEADLCEYTHIGDVYDDLKVTPLDTELLVPSCYKNDRKTDLDYKNKIIENVLRKLGFLDRTVEKVTMSEQQAIQIVQIHERARQGRLRAQFMREIRNMKEKAKPQGDSEESKDLISIPAALRIQKIWRGYVARRQTRRRKLQEMLLIGMVPPPVKQNEHLTRLREISEHRAILQQQYTEDFKAATKEARISIEKNQRGAILEQLSDQVRTWLSDYRAQTGKIPEYTTSERSTSRLLMSRQGTDSELSKSTQGSSKESKTKKAKPKKEEKSAEEEDETVCKALVSNFLPELTVRKEEYDEVWRHKEELSNPKQTHYNDMIEQEQTTELEVELKKVVDEMMKAELILLQEAFDKDRGHKGKKPKKASKKTRKGGKKSKKKKEKDLTPDRSMESLLEELVANGIVKQFPAVHLGDFIGERSYWNPAAHNVGAERRISLGDLRQLLAEFCAVPMLSAQLHESSTLPHIKSLLLAGPTGSGKDMLVHAVCTEVGATLFDLTPGNIVGKYPGKSGLIMLIHLVLKVARLLQPSIIYMDNAERPFVKKIPKTDRTDPKRLKKDLPKIIKNMAADDRIMLIGASNCPWESDQKLLQQVYQKYLFIPRPDYSSRFDVWTRLLRKYTAISWQFDISGVSKISDGYTVGSIVSTVSEIMTVKRMLQLRVHPLSPLELINGLAKRVPVYREEEEAMVAWWTKTPTCKRRLRAIEMLQEAEVEAQIKQANAKR